MAKTTYIGVGDTAKKVKDIYIGVDGVARKVTKAYIGDENGKARLCYEGATMVTFRIIMNDPWWSGDPDDLSDEVIETYTVPVGTTIAEAVEGKGPILDVMHDSYGYPEYYYTTNSYDDPNMGYYTGYYTLDGSENCDVRFDGALGPSTAITEDFAGDHYIVWAQESFEPGV